MNFIFLLLLHAVAMNSLAQLKPVASGVIHWADAPVKKDNLRETRRLAEGSTHEFEYFEIHVTSQEKGAVPKPAHIQKDKEEVIIVKEGSMKCTVGNKTAVIGPGGVILIPPLEMQSIENIGNGTLTYYVLISRSKKDVDMERSKQAGGALLLHADSLPVKETAKGSSKKYFERPTAMCENYEMHITSLTHKGPSHSPHTHIDTEIILVIEGETEMTIDGKSHTAGPGDLYIVESGKLHGISNATEKPCSYFAIRWR